MLLAGLAAAAAAEAAGEQLRFISCPVYRDTDAGKKSGCWLADQRESGQRYDVSLAPTKPDWNYAVLVEGVVAARQDAACGGIVLDPVRVSVLDVPCTRAMLPAEGYPGRVFRLPARNVRPLSEARPQPVSPYASRTYHLLFDYNSTFVVYQLDDYLLDEAISYIRAVAPRRVIVQGHAATMPTVVSGVRLAESASLARQRAEHIGEALRRLGVPEAQLEVRWTGTGDVIDAEGADGLREPSRRRVDIEIIVAADGDQRQRRMD
ncbi:MAG: OmpA family protein [Gammaproteobacteria bacterium]|nr:OmpA family protein [Gammaproteobacteria bacterium]